MAMYEEHAYGPCAFCGKNHKLSVITLNGTTVQECPNIRVTEGWHLPAIGPDEKHTVEVQTSVDDYDGEDDRDTDPPPPMSAVSCYWCGKKATVEIYHGIPSCGECHDRALRSKRR